MHDSKRSGEDIQARLQSNLRRLEHAEQKLAEHRLAQAELAALKEQFAALYEQAQQELAERKRAEEALNRSELQFRHVLENLPAGAYTCDAQGLITYFNPQAVRVWGRAPRLNDCVDRFCGSFKLFTTDGTPLNHDQCWMALALTNGKEYCGEEIVVERPDGSRITALAHATPLFDKNGTLLGAVNILVDIAEQKRVEAALREADQRKDEFLATLAHELRNPLAPIRNSLNILRMSGEASPSVERIHDMMERQIIHLVRLVDDLMEVSRITRGKIELRKEEVELAGILRTAVETSRPHIEAAGHQLAISIPPEPLVLDADPVRLAQVVANLLNNAAKYTEENGQIWLTARRERNDAVISVRDNGLGIPVDMRPRIFEMFAQVDRTSQRAQGGLGIGLTLARTLVEMHCGTIEVHSDGPGKGSEFVIRLPLKLASRCSEAPPTEPVQRAADGSRVLIVDDNRDSAESLGALLRLLGNEVRLAHDGRSAVEAVRAYKPAAVLLDIGMPGMDGYEVARTLRGEPDLQEVLLVALTGWGQEDDRRRSREAGFDHHLVKPVDMIALNALLASVNAKD
jgi:PAS domain S-box-containing protein